jgi:hypothetical protein
MEIHVTYTHFSVNESKIFSFIPNFFNSRLKCSAHILFMLQHNCFPFARGMLLDHSTEQNSANRIEIFKQNILY